MTKLFAGGSMEVALYFGVTACVQISRFYRITIDVAALCVSTAILITSHEDIDASLDNVML